MNKSKYVDISSIVQVIGNIYNHQNLLDMDEKYFFNEEDFTEDFHKIVFGDYINSLPNVKLDTIKKIA